jgi:tRNA nucleotidyltransferase/poly(A) polymerase
VEVVRRLGDAAHVAYFAGGCVRDRLMGHDPTDYDVATDARPSQITKLLDRARSVGESFGVMLVRSKGHTVQVATFRTDGDYRDGRHPEEVEFSDAEHDAQRRDFTINGLFEDPLTNQVIDYVGGQADLEARMIRAIGDPAARLREDRLRMLRAVRFAARFGFAIEPDTAVAIQAQADDLAGISRERIGQEIKRMLSDPNRAAAAWEIQYLGLDATVLDEPHREAALRRLSRLPASAGYATALAAWLLDRHAESEQNLDAIVRRWAAALILSNAEQAGLGQCLHVYRQLCGPWPQLGVAAQKRLAASPGFDQGLLLLQAADEQRFVDIRRRVLALAASQLAPAPLLTGNDLVGLGMTPGPGFKRVLDAVYDAQLEGSIRLKDEAMALARSIAEGTAGR